MEYLFLIAVSVAIIYSIVKWLKKAIRSVKENRQLKSEINTKQTKLRTKEREVKKEMENLAKQKKK